MQHQAAPHEPPDRPAVAAAVGGRRPFLIGIGGSGMSALARLLAAEGMPVRGSDSTESPATRALQAAGIPVDPRQVAESLDESADLVIASAAIRPDHAQVVEAVRRGITVLTYAEALGRCMSVRTGVCVAGTHGKSTTTAMLGCALTDAGLDPSVIVGATCGQLASGCVVPHDAPPHPPMPSTQLDRERGFRLGSARVPGGAFAGRPGLLIAEACEYNRSFHHHRPTLATIANVEADHLDIYGSLDAVIEAFAGFAALIPPAAQGGRLIIGHDGAHRRQITAGLACRVDTIGFAPQADWRVDLDRASGLIRLQGPDGHHAAWTLAMPGEHNAMNSAVAAAAAIAAGADGLCIANTTPAMAIDVHSLRPALGNVTGGLSGPAVHPIVTRLIYDAHAKVARAASVPIIGIGGVMDWRDAAEFILAGASAVQVGTATFVDPRAPLKIHRGLERWARRLGRDILALTGAAHPPLKTKTGSDPG